MTNDEIITELVNRGVSAETMCQIVKAMTDVAVFRAEIEALEARRARDAERKRRWRERPRTSEDTRPRTSRDGHVTVTGQNRPIEEERKKESKEVSTPRLRGRAKVPIPDPWPDAIAMDQSEEFDRFRDHALANARLCADWQAAWRNWLRSPYRKTNGGSANGRHERERPASERARELAEECRRRERELGLDPLGSELRRKAFNVGSN